MSDAPAHMWLVAELGRGGAEDMPKVICPTKEDAKRWIAEQNPELEITGERQTYFAATRTGPYWVIRYTAHRLPFAGTIPAETDR